MLADGVLSNADIATYAAKHRGKGRWLLIDELDEELRKTA
jgi:predicted signal transduction protein with EAL and GGDEF domain